MRRFVLLVLLVAISPREPLHSADAPLDSKLTTFRFTGHAFLHNFDGQARDFEGGAQIDPAAPDFVTTAVIDIATARLTTFQDTRDRHMAAWLQTQANPRIEYRLEKIERRKDETVRATRNHPAHFTVTGDFTLNHTTRLLTAAVLGWREKDLLIVTGQTKIDTTTYGLPIVRQLFMTVDRNVDVSFRLVFDLPPGWDPATPGR